MAQKRSAKEAFGASNGQLSAAAAARQAKLLKDQAQTEEADDLVGSIAGIPYNGHHSGTASDEDEEAEILVKKSNFPTIRFSTFNPSSAGALQEADDGKSIQITLQAEETATFIGEYDLEVLKGIVTIYGVMLHPDLEPHRVHALSTHALPSMTARGDSMIRLTSVKTGLQKLAKLSPLFRNIGCEKGARSFQFLAFNTSDPLGRPLVTLEIDDVTKRILSRLNAKLETSATPTTILAIGPKSSGKSTFNRLLCNMIISRPGPVQKCWYLDLDPGQPEFGPPGQVSLVEVSVPVLGPPYTHPANSFSKHFRLLRSHTIAATTFKDDAEHYLACAADLLDLAATTPLPMVINSCGWTSGLGASTLLSLINKLISPEVVLLGEPTDSELSQSLPAALSQHIIPRRIRVQSAKTPAEQRAMSTMAYFHLKQSQKNTEGISWNPKPLSKMKHWILPYNEEAEQGLTAILSYDQAPHHEFLAETIDGAVVAIVATVPGLVPTENVRRTDGEDLPYIPDMILDPKRSHCLGLVLIRGVDVNSKILQLLTPVDFGGGDLEGKGVVLVRGGFDPPDWAYLEDLYGGEKDVEARPWVALSGDIVEHGKVWRVRRPPMPGSGKG